MMDKRKLLAKRKCHQCHGQGKVRVGDHEGRCLYCRGKGYRTSFYGVDKI